MRVTIVGAGPAGASAAAAVAASGFDTLLTDPGGRQGWRVGEGLPGAAGVHLRSLGVWEAFQAGGHLPGSGFLSRWGGGEPAFRSTLFDPHGPSWQIDRSRFDRMLVDAAAAAGVRGPLPWRLVGVRHRRPGWRLSFIDGATVRRVETDFVIDATGRRSGFARLLGMRRQVDSSLVAIAGLLPDPDAEDARTIVQTTEHGWWYASRVPGGRLVAALFTDARTCAGGGLAGIAGWVRALDRADLVRERTGWPPGRPYEGLRTTAAGSSRIVRPGARDWIAVGDAASAHDPLSSRGLYEALSTGLAGARCVERAAAGDDDAGHRYATTVAQAYDGYLRELAWFYGQEDRFPTAPFWRSRTPAAANRA